MRSWTEYSPADAKDLILPHPDVQGPINEAGEPCPWPWEPQQMVGVPLGQYHCPYCGAMVMAGMPHPDYAFVDHDEQAADVVWTQEDVEVMAQAGVNDTMPPLELLDRLGPKPPQEFLLALGKRCVELSLERINKVPWWQEP